MALDNPAPAHVSQHDDPEIVSSTLRTPTSLLHSNADVAATSSSHQRATVMPIVDTDSPQIARNYSAETPEQSTAVPHYANPLTASDSDTGQAVAAGEAISTDDVGKGKVCCSPEPSWSTDEMCRICHCGWEAGSSLVAPCLCTGSLRQVHRACLQRWLQASGKRQCELCRFQFFLKTTTKPLSEWCCLPMSRVERRKIICSVTFHAIALTCVLWSLFVLIERTAEEAAQGVFEWPFWTKLIVIAVGFTGGVVFVYVQCRMYLSIFRRWRAHNQTFKVQSVPAEILQTARQAAKEKAAAVIVNAQCDATLPIDVSFISGGLDQWTTNVLAPQSFASPSRATSQPPAQLSSVSQPGPSSLAC